MEFSRKQYHNNLFQIINFHSELGFVAILTTRHSMKEICTTEAVYFDIIFKVYTLHDKKTVIV